MTLDDRIKEYQEEVARFRLHQKETGYTWPDNWTLVDDLIADREILKTKLAAVQKLAEGYINDNGAMSSISEDIWTKHVAHILIKLLGAK